MQCKEGRTLELSVEVNVAPGFLSAYTKIVRFLPRYVVFNRLDRPIRLWQDSSVFRPVSEDRAATASDTLESSKDSRKWRYDFEDKHHHEKISQYEQLYGRPGTIDDRKDSLKQKAMRVNPIPDGTTAHRSALYVTSMLPSELAPFILPDSRAERQLRVDLGGIFNVTSSFASNLPGEHTLKVSRATDARLLKHVSTRAAPKYKIVLPPPGDAAIGDWDGELGVFFETDWGGDRRIIVKGTRRGKYAFNHTDIHVGDELLRVDGVSVVRMSFSETMKLIKERLAYISSLHVQRKRRRQKKKESKRGSKRGMLLRRLSAGVSGVVRKERRFSGGGYSRQSSADGNVAKPAQLTLTFRTLEERLRKLRLKASRDDGLNRSRHNPLRPGLERGMSARTLQSATDQQNSIESEAEVDSISVEMKSLHNTMFVILRPQDKENPLFRIQNRSINHIVFYRQRGCDGHPWNQLMPGESLPYAWEEPMRSKKLTVRVAAKSQDLLKADFQGSSHDLSDLESVDNDEPEFVTSADQEKQTARAARLRQSLAYQFVDTEERGGYGPSIVIKLEEIGYRNFLPVPSKEGGRKRRKFLNCEVDTDGGTRLLVVSDDSNAEDERSTLNRHLETLRKQISFEQERQAGLLSLRSALSKPDLKNSLRSVGETTEENEGVENDTQVEREASIEADAKRLVEDYPEESTISSRHQVVVEVLETAGLNASDFVGSCNPYCEVFLKGRSKSRQHFFQKRKNKRKTFFIEKSLNPKWTDQVFVFDVTEEAVMVTRGHSIQVKVRNFRLVGGHPIMGHASVHFGSLRNQQELSGWYPLAGRTGRSDVETAKFSDGSRGSIKLRVQWVYSTPALIDYFLLLSERHLEQLTKSRKGMMDQLSHAIESDQRKREARDQLNSGRIQKLAKLQKKELRVTSARNVKEGEKVVGKKVVGKINQAVNQGLNSSISVLKDTMKASRDRYLYALYFQTVESRKNRQMKEQEETEETQDLASHNDSVGHSMNLAELPMITEQKSPGSLAGSLASSKRTLEDFLSQQRAKTITQSPRHAENGNKKTLGDFFAQNRDENQDDTEERQKSPFLSPSGRARRSLLGEIENGRRPQNHRRLSLDIDEPLYEENGNGEQIDQARSSLYQNANFYDNLYGQTPDFASISDLISVGTDVDEEAKRAKAIKALRMLGFVFHDSGVYFHEDHLPHHFRRSLFASSMEERKSVRLYRPKFAVGTASAMRHFKTWQAAQALHLDPELDVVRTDDAFLICFKEKTSSPPKKKLNISASKSAIVETLAVPEMSPITTIARAQSRVETMHLSRSRFERACKRTLGAVLNPGGWLTIRPITVLNLPDTYTGMFVKLRYGSGVLVSETVDAKVTPRWTAPDSFDSPVEGKATRGRRRSAATVGPVENEKFEFNENDLHVHVEPQQTSGAIKISVVAERLNTKTELGVLQIPLGAAIAACIDSAESMGDSDPIENSTGPPMYIRWFPLTNPRLAVPVEGDMGLSNRPKESEQLRDNMFQQYFAPCIQLALIWWPDGNKPDDKEAEGSYSESSSGALAVRGPSGSAPATMTPLIQNYFNADVGRISAALIDSQRAVELLSFSALDIDMRYSVTKTKTRIGLVVGWIQLDHQDNRAREPVVLAPTPAEHLQPTLQLLALKDNLRTKSNIVSYEYIGVALQEMDLTVEESWVFELWDFFMGVMRRNQAKKNKTKGQKRADLILTENCFTASDLEDSVAPSLLSILEGAGEEGSAAAKRKVYVEQLILGLVKVNLSYVKGKKQSWELTDEGAKAMKNLEVKELLYLENVARNDQSEVFVKWSQHTYDEDLLAQSGGKF